MWWTRYRIDEEADETDEGTLKNIDLLSAFNDLSTSDDVTSLITDEDNTLVDEPSAMEDSLIASEELQSALMLYNDSFPVGQETVIENGKKYIPFLCIKGGLISETFSLWLKSPKKCAKSPSVELQ